MSNLDTSREAAEARRERRREIMAEMQGETCGVTAGSLAVDFVLDVLSEALGDPAWTVCDGSETWDGDVAGTVYSLLRAAGVIDEDTGDTAMQRAKVAAADSLRARAALDAERRLSARLKQEVDHNIARANAAEGMREAVHAAGWRAGLVAAELAAKRVADAAHAAMQEPGLINAVRRDFLNQRNGARDAAAAIRTLPLEPRHPSGAPT